jgi:glucose-fructose oxidoreductase
MQLMDMSAPFLGEPFTSCQANKGDAMSDKAKSSKRKIRYAVVGTGHIAQVAILPAFKTVRNSELVAIVSGDSQKREELSKKYGLQFAYSYDEYDQALSKVDAVYLALPNHLHSEYSVRAAKAGVHVLCEKPMAVTEEECESMIQAAEESKIKLMIAYRLHFERGNLEAIDIAKSGKLGNPRFFSSDFAQQVAEGNIRLTEPVEKGGGPVYDMGVYCINAARYLFQDEPTEILSSSASSDDSKFKQAGEMVSVVMRFPSERLASFTCSFGAADIGRYTLVGTKGTLTADPAYEYASGIKHRVTIDGQTTNKNFPKRDQFAAEITYFSNCIRKNQEPEPSGLEGLADVRIVRAIYESANSGKSVKLPDFTKKRRPSLGQEIHNEAHGKPETVNVESPSGEAA